MRNAFYTESVGEDISLSNIDEEEEKPIVQRIARLTDVAEELQEHCPRMDAFKTTPLVSLEEAVVKLVHIIPNIQHHADRAKQRCEKPVDGLTQDESASVILYSMEWEPHKTCLYAVLNAILRSEDQEKIEPWLLYMRLLLSALFRLPSISETVYRGVKVDLTNEYTKGKRVVWWGFSSCTKSVHVLQSESFLGQRTTRTMFSIKCHSGKSIRNHSCYPSEDEVLIPAGTEFKVVSCLSQGDLRIIQLEQTGQHLQLIPTPVRSADINFNSKWNKSGKTIAGGKGRGNGHDQLNFPEGLYVDDSDILYIADCDNHRIVEWELGAEQGVVVTSNGKHHSLNNPKDVVLDKISGSLNIYDKDNGRIVRWPRQGGEETIISNAQGWGLTMDKEGSIYVSDANRHEVRRYSNNGTQPTVVAGKDGKGKSLNELDTPSFIFVDRDHSVYVSDSRNHRVMKWERQKSEGVLVAGGRGEGHSLSQLSHPQGIIVDQWGNVFVADQGNHRIVKWTHGTTEGIIIIGDKGKGSGSNQLNCPTGLSFDKHGNLFVVDSGNHRVQKFELDQSSL